VAQFSPYLPGPGRTESTLSLTWVTFDHLWAGSTRVSTRAAIGSSGKDQVTTQLSVERGLSERWAADLTLGYTRADLGSFPSDEGMTDAALGLRMLLIDELESDRRYLPTVAVRLGGIASGNYDAGLPFSAGDGASGVDLAILMGRAISPRLSLVGDVGYRWRDEGVPEEIFAGIGAGWRWGRAILSTGVRYEGSVSGLDIFGPGFGTVGGFPQTRERNTTVHASIGLPVASSLFLQIYGGRSLSGRNTGDKRIIGAAGSWGF